MSVLRSIWSSGRQTARGMMIASVVVVVAGMAVIILGVSAGWGQTRLPGALLISVGGAAAGSIVGFSRPLRDQIWSRLMRWRVRIALMCAVVIATPAILAMASATIGPVAGGGDAKDTALVLIGALTGLIFMVGTFLAALVAIIATRDRVASAPQRESNGEPREERA